MAHHPLLDHQPLDFNNFQYSHWTFNISLTRLATPLDFNLANHCWTYNNKGVCDLDYTYRFSLHIEFSPKMIQSLTSIYNLSVTQKLEEKMNFYSNFTWIWICWAKFRARISLIMISEFKLWFSLLIQDQVQDSTLSVLRCHEACKTWRICTKCDYMMW